MQSSGIAKLLRRRRVALVRGCLSLMLLSGLLLTTPVVHADEDSPKHWLQRMSAAMQELSYQGVFVYRREDDMAAMRVTHVVDEHGARELLETLTGQARSEVRRAPLVAGEGAGEPQLNHIDRYYQLRLLGSDRAAGREARVIAVSPRDEYRYGYRLWLDHATGLLLKSDLLSQDGDTLEQVMFTALELLDRETVKQLAPAPDRQGDAHAAVDGVAANSVSAWVVTTLPDGFELLKSHPGSGHGEVEHLVYSDGLASVSVFVERANGQDDAFEGGSRMGAVNAYGSLIDGGFQVTVVGEVPEITVQTIGRSIQRQGAE